MSKNMLCLSEHKTWWPSSILLPIRWPTSTEDIMKMTFSQSLNPTIIIIIVCMYNENIQSLQCAKKCKPFMWESVCIKKHNSYMLFGLYYERILLFTMIIYDIRDPWTWVGGRNQIFFNLPVISAHTVTFNALYTRSWYSCNTPLPLFIKTLGIRDGLVSSGFSGIPVMNLYK